MAKTQAVEDKRAVTQIPSKTKVALVKKVPKDLQAKIDDYITKTKEKNKLESELKALKPFIEGYMDEQNLFTLRGSVAGGIDKIPTSRPKVTSRYTYYDPEIIVAELPMEVARKCIVEVVDKEIVDAFAVLGIIDEDVIDSAKTSTSSFNYKVR